MNPQVLPSDISFFIEVVNADTLGAAAQKLGVSVAAVSKRLTQLEKRTNSILLMRTVRRLLVTPEGALFLHHGRRMLFELESLQQALRASTEEPRGLLRVSASLGFGREHIAPAIARFAEKHPEIEISLTLSESVTPIAEDVCDVSVRFGAPPDSRAIARLLTSNSRLICAAPSYLAARGTPNAPEDLVHHECIDLRQGSEAHGIWRFVHKRASANQVDAIKIKGRFASNDGAVTTGWALAGLGVIMRSQWDVERYLKSGQLVQVLADWSTPSAPIYAIYPEAHRRSLRVRAFTDFLVERFSEPSSI